MLTETPGSVHEDRRFYACGAAGLTAGAGWIDVFPENHYDRTAV